MFAGCYKIKEINLSFIDFSNQQDIKTMSGVFLNCEQLENVYVNNEEIVVSDFNSLFAGCKSLSTLDLSFLNNRQFGYGLNALSNMHSLKTLKVGSNFTFHYRNGTHAGLTSPDNYVWVNVDTGEQYKDSSTMPDFVAATYELRPIK